MIVNRRTMIVKPGCWDGAVASVVAETKRLSFPHPRRILTVNIGPFDRLVFEAEFESLAEYEKFWAEYFASPEGVAFTEKLNSMLVSGGSNEIWTLEEYN
jgi:hypothetical protein